MKRIGLFGGTFDPVHIGHLLLAQIATEELNLDALFFIPAGQPPFKTDIPVTPGAVRLQMLRLALAGKTKWYVDSQEIQRGGVSYTIDTVREYAKRYPTADLFYILGADQARMLHLWKDIEELQKLVKFVVFSRPGEEGLNVSNVPVRVVQSLQIGISASVIRSRVKENKPIDFFVPPQVAEFIQNKGLYK